ncbi:MAG TPA: sarcosine oxidase subunit gamma family protein [Pseudonocardiaceae bacterium]|nr:sarcosine oxidase subunit gamma family protein [Pseudonocardiaceae bacterium]
MTAEPATARRGPLADHPLELTVPGLSLGELPFLTMVNVRVRPGELDVPAGSARTVGEWAVLWLGPDERLVVGPAAGSTDLVGGLPTVDVSASRTTLTVAGVAARELLATGCPLDLHPRVFGPGSVAQSTVGRAQVILWQTTDLPVYRLLVRASFAGYLADWLTDAAVEHTGRSLGAGVTAEG